MLLPALSAAKAKAKRITCVSQTKQWGLAQAIYATDNNDGIPRDGMGGNAQYMPTSTPPPTGTPDDLSAWFNLLPQNVAEKTLQFYYQQPIGNNRVKMPFAGDVPANTFTGPKAGKMWECSSATMSDSDYQQLQYGGNGGFFSYAFNIDLKKDPNSPGSNLPHPKMPKLTNIPKPTATVLMFDVVYNPVTEIVNASPQFNSVNPANRFRSIGVRHDKGTVITFCDGHSKYFRIFSVTNNPTGASEPENPDIIWDWTSR